MIDFILLIKKLILRINNYLSTLEKININSKQ